jgi:hypothetical protein
MLLAISWSSEVTVIANLLDNGHISCGVKWQAKYIPFAY